MTHDTLTQLTLTPTPVRHPLVLWLGRWNGVQSAIGNRCRNDARGPQVHQLLHFLGHLFAFHHGLHRDPPRLRQLNHRGCLNARGYRTGGFYLFLQYVVGHHLQENTGNATKKQHNTAQHSTTQHKILVSPPTTPAPTTPAPTNATKQKYGRHYTPFPKSTNNHWMCVLTLYEVASIHPVMRLVN